MSESAPVPDSSTTSAQPDATVPPMPYPDVPPMPWTDTASAGAPSAPYQIPPLPSAAMTEGTRASAAGSSWRTAMMTRLKLKRRNPPGPVSPGPVPPSTVPPGS